MSEPTPHSVAQTLWTLAQLPAPVLEHLVFEDGQDLPSRFHVGALAAGTIGAQALIAALIWADRTGIEQTVRVDMRHALAAFRSEQYLWLNGEPAAEPPNDLHGYYPVANRQWVQLHTTFDHHRDGVLRILGCEPTREAVTQALQSWQAEQLELQLAQAELVGAAVRTTDQWSRHTQAGALSRLPIMEIQRIGDAPVQPLGRGEEVTRPLSGVRVLDLSRVIAAPVAARTLASHGADVLAISAPHLQQVRHMLMDTGRGKRHASLDLREAGDADRLLALTRQSDVFLQAYRPGGLAARDFGPEALARARPGIVYVSLSAYGHIGPWSTRRGYDSLVQSATGIAHEEGLAAGLEGPGQLPCQALDHASGYLAAFGAMVALRRRALEGGSWHVRVSLAQTARWLRSLGEREDGHSNPDLTSAEIDAWLHEMDTPWGRLRAIRPAEQLSHTPARFERPSVPAGHHPAEWATD